MTTNPETGQVVTKFCLGRTLFSEKPNAAMASNLWEKFSQGNILRDTLMISRETVNTASSKINNHKMWQPVPVSPTLSFFDLPTFENCFFFNCNYSFKFHHLYTYSTKFQRSSFTDFNAYKLNRNKLACTIIWNIFQ